MSAAAISDEVTPLADAPHVLVIDDHATLRALHARILSRNGYRVDTAEDASAALHLLRTVTFDLIVSDITMPGMSGIELVEQLRASQNDIPVVLVTGDPQLETAVKAVEHGVTRYLTKPVEGPTLLGAATAAIRLHGLARAERLALDNACLRSLVEELARVRAAERAAGRAKSDFLAQMSHELRTPLGHIMGFTELALDTKLSTEQRDYLDKSLRSAAALLALIENVLQFSRLDCGKIPLESSTIATRVALAETLSPLIASAKRKGLAIAFEIDPCLPEKLRGDAPKFRQVTEHIVGNAIKFTRVGGTIAVRADLVSLSQGVALVRVSVKDSGVGIAIAVREQIFGAFSQADNSVTRAYGGAGLGLTLSKQLVQLMGGTLDVDSVPGLGTTVAFTGQFEVRE